MSTKIYTGVTLPMMGVQELNAWAKAVRQQLDGLTEVMHHRFLAVCATHRFDDALMQAVGLPTETEGPALKEHQSAMGYAYDIWQDRRDRVKKEQRRDPVVDTSAQLVVMGHPHDPTRLLGIYFTEARDLEAAIRALPGVEPYGYWNNVDPDDSVSEAEWEARGQAWDDAFGAEVTASAAGITVELTTDRVYWAPPQSPESIDQHVPSHADRVKRLAKQLAMHRRLEAAKAAGEEPSGFSELMDWRAQLTAEHPLYQEAHAQVSAVLPEVITLAMLRAKDRTPWHMGFALEQAVGEPGPKPARPRI